MKQIFYTIKDSEGILRPMAFITSEEAVKFENPNLEDGDTLVRVEMEEVKE